MSPAPLTDFEAVMVERLRIVGRIYARDLGIGQQGVLHRAARKGACIEHGSQRYNAYRYWTKKAEGTQSPAQERHNRNHDTGRDQS